MDLKSLLSQLDQLNEATKETEKGKVHTAEPGGYGRKFDTDEEGDEKKAEKAEAPKRGRGRPKKGADDSGEVKKYDFSAFGAGKAAKLKPWDKKKTTKHSLKEYFDQLDSALNEAEQVTVQPAQSNTQVIKQGTKTLGTVTNPQLANQIKQSIGKGEMSLAGDELGEDGDYSAKRAAAGKDIGKPGKNFAKIAKSSGGGDKGKRIAGAVLAKLRSKTNEADLPPNDSMASPLTLEGKKAKPDFLDVDGDNNEKESMKKAASDKKKKVDEGIEHRLNAARAEGRAHGLRGHAHCGKSYDDLEEARLYHEGYKEGLDECYGMAPIAGMQEEMPAHVSTMAASADPIIDEMGMDEGNAFTAALNRTPTGGKFSVGGKTFTDHSSIEETDSVFESWDNELNSLLEEYNTIQEGMSVSINKGQQNMPDSVTVSAQDGEAEQLLSLIKQAGLGLFGGEESPAQDMQRGNDAMTIDSGEPAEIGASNDDIDVVGDHDGMMALIKKVTGDAGQPDVVAIGGSDEADGYEDEEGHDHEQCDACGSADCECDDSSEDEKAEQVDEVESEDQQEYEVAEDNAPDSGAAEEEEEIQDTAQANKSAAEYDAAEEDESLNEWANDAGQKGTDEAFEADIDFMVNAITGGLNGRKSTGQATVPVIANQVNRTVSHATTDVNESISDWKALAGIK